jgi:Phosphotransferase enzyme family
VHRGRESQRLTVRFDTDSATKLNTSEIESSVKSDINSRPRLGGAEDVKDRIACALSAGHRQLMIDPCRYGPSKLTARCTGDWNGKRFFAKILLADPFPVPARFSVPWEVPRGAPPPVRPVGDQIEIEWYMTLKMRALSQGECVPTPFGRSVQARTIVWEEALGTPLVRLVKRSRWKRSIARTGIRALFQAGRWLRKVHDASRRGDEMIDMPDLINRARNFARQMGPQTSEYDCVVPKILETALPEVGSGGFRVPVAFTHGDFCLSNLIKASASGRLTVIDFEMCDIRPIHHDLFGLVSELHSQLLNPIVPKFVIRAWEEAFWAGYGPTSRQMRSFVKALALARVFYHDLFRMLSRRERKGWVAGLNAQLYRTILEPVVLTRRLGLSRELCSFRPQVTSNRAE